MAFDDCWDNLEGRVEEGGFYGGVAAVYLYLQASHTGPAIAEQQLSKVVAGKSIKDLEIDAFRPYALTRGAALLAYAKDIVHAEWNDQDERVVLLWRARVDFMHQQVMDEAVPQLYDSITSAYESIIGSDDGDGDEVDRDGMGALYIEYALCLIWYDRIPRAKEYIKKAANIMGLEWILTGVLGRRTKFQTFDASQMVLLSRSNRLQSNAAESSFPKLALNHDTLLERPVYNKDQLPPGWDADPNDQGELHALDACALLAWARLTRAESNPMDAIVDEQVLPFLERALDCPNWSVQSLALVLKSKIEAKRAKTAERSLLQLQAIADQISDQVVGGQLASTSFLPKPADTDLHVKERMEFIWQLNVPSVWELESDLAKAYLAFGLLRSAVDIYERLEMWEEVALCYAASGQEAKAIAVILEQLKRDPTDPKYWTLLGDIEENPSHWEQAVKVSKGKFAKAFRSLGRYWYKQGDTQKAIENFKSSLQINPLVFSAWFTYGCCFIDMNNWNDSAEAFRKCISIEHDDGEAWSNLATCYLRQTPPRMTDAHKALEQAVRLKHDSWKVWDNYATVCMSLGDWFGTIRSLQRIAELKGTEDVIDVEALNQVISNTVRQDDPSKSLHTALSNLVQTIIPLITRRAQLWQSLCTYYSLTKDYKAALDASEKGFRAVQNESLGIIMPHLTRLIECYENFGPLIDGGALSSDWKYKARSAMRLVKSRHRDEIDERINTTLSQLEEQLSSNHISQ